MTDKDKTGDQLVASIRKTKRTATVSKKGPTRRAPAKPTTMVAKAATGPDNSGPSPGNYQSAGRVWPD